MILLGRYPFSEIKYCKFLGYVPLSRDRQYVGVKAIPCETVSIGEVVRFINVETKQVSGFYKVLNLLRPLGLQQIRIVIPGEITIFVVAGLEGVSTEDILSVTRRDKRKINSLVEGVTILEGPSEVYVEIVNKFQSEANKIITNRGMNVSGKISHLKTLSTRYLNELRNKLEKEIPNSDPQKKDKIETYINMLTTLVGEKIKKIATTTQEL